LFTSATRPCKKIATSKESCSTCVQDYDGGGLRGSGVGGGGAGGLGGLSFTTASTAQGSSAAAGPLPDRIAKFREGTRPCPDLFALGVYRSIEVYFFKSIPTPTIHTPPPNTSGQRLKNEITNGGNGTGFPVAGDGALL